eukprot:gene6981-8898_t
MVYPLYAASNFINDDYNYFFTIAIFAGEVSVACVLTVNMLFIAVDADVSARMVDQLLVQAEQKTITRDALASVRSDIAKRVSDSASVNNGVILVAMLDIIVVVLVLLFFLDKYPAYVQGILITLFIKELPFLLIIFLKSASVNERADRLVIQLA